MKSRKYSKNSQLVQQYFMNTEAGYGGTINPPHETWTQIHQQRAFKHQENLLLTASRSKDPSVS